MAGKAKMAGRMVAPIALRAAPGLASGFVRQAFDRAVDGTGPLRGAAAAADRRLGEHDGDVRAAIGSLVDSHVKLAGAQGFVTNLGGFLAMTVTAPANVSGLALLQCHMVGGIAHLRGYDLADPRVRNAVLACMLGRDTVRRMVKKGRLPSSPMAIATAPAYDPSLDERISSDVAAELLARVAGKRGAAALAKRMPVVGGGIGAVTDGYLTFQVGQFAAKELRSRRAA
jgi:EcsC protein family